MFRKMAIALLAASVFTAPALAQSSNTLSGGAASKNPPATSAPPSDTTEKADKTEKSEKSAESAEKSGKTARHHRVASRHHRHGTKAVKIGKSRTPTAMAGKPHGARTPKYAKSESRGRTSGMAKSSMAKSGKVNPRHLHAYGRGSKHMMPKPSAD
jgi:hypothetical protein